MIKTQLARGAQQIARSRSVRSGLLQYCQTNSIATRRPTKAAARCKLDKVMSRFGSSMRSTCDRLVFSNTAICAFEIFLFFMALASCQATTSLMACACASSKMFSSLRKSSTLDPRFFLLIVPTPSVACVPASSHLRVYVAFS